MSRHACGSIAVSPHGAGHRTRCGVVNCGSVVQQMILKGIRAFTDVVGQSRQFPVGFRSECRREFAAQFSCSRQVLGNRLILFAAIGIFPDMCVILQNHHSFMDISLSR